MLCIDTQSPTRNRRKRPSPVVSASEGWGLAAIERALLELPVEFGVGRDAVLDYDLIDHALLELVGVLVAQDRDLLVALGVDAVEPKVGRRNDALAVEAAVEDGERRAADVVGNLHVGGHHLNLGAAAREKVRRAEAGVRPDAVIEEDILGRRDLLREDIP